MTICFNNQSEVCINIFIGNSQFILPRKETYIHTCSFDHMPVEIKMSISDAEIASLDKSAICLDISTLLLCDFTISPNTVFTIKKNQKKFQNYTEYRYLTIESFNLNTNSINYVVDNFDSSKYTASQIHDNKKDNILSIIKKSLIDMFLDGFLLSALLAWIFTWKVALATLLAIFLIALIINFIKSKTSKSKHRVLNWDKDIDQPDDIQYFITHLDKYCN